MKEIVLVLVAAWAIGLFVLGDPDSPLSPDGYRIY